MENLCTRLQPINFYHKIVKLDTIPTSGLEKLKYNATRLTRSVAVQEYQMMIQEGLGYSYLTTGLRHVQLWVPFNDPSTLYYDLCWRRGPDGARTLCNACGLHYAKVSQRMGKSTTQNNDSGIEPMKE